MSNLGNPNVAVWFESEMAIFPHEEKAASGCIMAGNGYKPTKDVAIVYLHSTVDLDVPLSKVEKAGIHSMQ